MQQGLGVPFGTGSRPTDGAAQGVSTADAASIPNASVSLAIIGSRSFSNSRLAAEILDPLVPALREVVSGGARGADKVGEQWAAKRGVPTTIYYPDFKRYRHPYHHRNRLIAERCDQLIAFWDGRSSGTKYTIDYAKRLGKPVRVVRF